MIPLPGNRCWLAACEVSGTVAAYTMGGAAAEVPAPEDAVILYTNDVHLRHGRIFLFGGLPAADAGSGV